MKGTFETIYYLQRLGSDHFDLILEYATWVLQVDPDKGMDVSLKIFFFFKKKKLWWNFPSVDGYSIILIILYIDFYRWLPRGWESSKG